jgi:hypothetical protein
MHHRVAEVRKALENSPIQYAEMEQGFLKRRKRVFRSAIVQFEE